MSLKRAITGQSFVFVSVSKQESAAPLPTILASRSMSATWSMLPPFNNRTIGIEKVHQMRKTIIFVYAE